jgi:hypothetical protein
MEIQRGERALLAIILSHLEVTEALIEDHIQLVAALLQQPAIAVAPLTQQMPTLQGLQASTAQLRTKVQSILELL